MGVNNKARRAAKARQRAKHRAHGAGPRRYGDPRSDAGQALATLAELWDDYEGDLHRVLVAIWNGGWQPVELVREVRRSTKGAWPVDLLRRLIAVDHARREPATLHPRWSAQIDSLDLPDVPPESGWLTTASLEHPEADASAPGTLLHTLASLGPLPRLIPPPGAAPGDVDIDLATGAMPGADDHDPILERVRALLAQAESTNYPAEAEVFTAKAHALMTRHAIDAALVDPSATTGGWTTALRIPIDDPYLDTKSLLLQIVAEHSRCRAVFHTRYAMSTVVGASGDVAGTELMFTSLLLQAQQALLAEGDKVGAGAPQRSRSFRSSFLFAYANRIGERLAEANASVIAEADAAAEADSGTGRGGSVLPVLAERSKIVDEAFDQLFGDLVSSSVRSGWNAAGWSSGRRAADQARLGEPDLPAGHEATSIGPAAPAGQERLPFAS